MANFNPAHKAVLDDLLGGDPRVRPGKMFGFPAYAVGRKYRRYLPVFEASIRFIAAQQEASVA